MRAPVIRAARPASRARRPRRPPAPSPCRRDEALVARPRAGRLARAARSSTSTSPGASTVRRGPSEELLGGQLALAQRARRGRTRAPPAIAAGGVSAQAPRGRSCRRWSPGSGSARCRSPAPRRRAPAAGRAPAATPRRSATVVSAPMRSSPCSSRDAAQLADAVERDQVPRRSRARGGSRESAPCRRR